jgi:hypothetical protein
MAHVILQPSANQDARQHYVDTIQTPVAFHQYSDLISLEVLNQLNTLFPEGAAPMWGVTPGTKGVNISKFNRAGIGDVVLFAAEGRIFGSGTVAIKFHNAALAARLWDFDAKGRTWEYMYALDEIRALDISYADFNAVVGYKENNVIQGFTVMDEEKSAAFLDSYDLWSSQHETPISDEEWEAATTALDGEMDRQVKSWVRAEQSRARKLLLGNKLSGECRLCGRTFPKAFLVAAHKKKRAKCDDSEKRDIKNVMMLCCLFGCDALYESGFISVDSLGTIVRSSALPTGAVCDYALNVVKPKIEVTPAEQNYFAWHASHTFRA